MRIVLTSIKDGTLHLCALKNTLRVCGLMMPGSHEVSLLLGKANPKAMAVGGKGTNKGNELPNPQAMAVG